MESAVIYAGGCDVPPEVRWAQAWATALVRLAYDRFGSGVRPAAAWDEVVCEACWCGRPRWSACWYCPPVELVEVAA